MQLTPDQQILINKFTHFAQNLCDPCKKTMIKKMAKYKIFKLERFKPKPTDLCKNCKEKIERELKK